MAKIKKDEKIDHYETKRRRKDGEIIDVSVTISPVKDITGKISGTENFFHWFSLC
jgi:PAS domain-containing protein